MLWVAAGDLDGMIRRLASMGGCVMMVVPAATAITPPAGLTERETKVLEGVAAGQSNAQIARELNTTEGSIKGSVQSLFRKLGVRPKRRTALVRAAVACSPAPELTAIERSVMENLKEDRTNREVARLLQIPEIAVKAAIRGACAKLGLVNRRQLLRLRSRVLDDADAPDAGA